MLELVIASLLPTVTVIVAFWWIKRSLPILIQSVLNDVGEQLNEIFANPTVKKAYTILGKQGAEVKHDEALRNRVAEKAISESPALKKVLEYFEVTPIEGLKLLNDPLLQPIIAKFTQGGIKSSRLP